MIKVEKQDDQKKRILFICTHNSARSQMAEGILRSLYGNRFEVFSAGTEPTKVNPNAVIVMAELDIDISEQGAKSVHEFRGMSFDLVVTVCDKAKEACPFFPGATNYLHKSFEDPARLKGSDDEILMGFRQMRDEIKEWLVEMFGGGDED